MWYPYIPTYKSVKTIIFWYYSKNLGCMVWGPLLEDMEMRNNHIFNQCFIETESIIMSSWGLVEDMVKAFSTRQMGLSHFVARWLRMVGWEASSVEWCKLNTDDARRLSDGVASYGGVLRDSIGTWLCGYARNLGICGALDAQIWV